MIFNPPRCYTSTKIYSEFESKELDMPVHELGIYVFILAAFLGLELIRRVSPLLHTPLMSLTNAISAISVVGAIVIAGEENASTFSRVLGFIAVTTATINVVSGYLITDRMLKMFKKQERGKP
ncbi:MAG TPA: NAD(P) transhydrogenase subunit alpha [Bryobacteraceae bacterium]|nr:NAD(P) transhydrogenase subunit alpha [Bryobacteraceae bacterium]